MKTRTCYLYVLPLVYEDIAKLGLSHDPLMRAQAFSPRYYDFFDLPGSLLVEFDSRREAQARETELHRRLHDWNAMQPITVPGRAAGKTEWYRGARTVLHEEIARDAAAGRAVHAPALGWWQVRLRAERPALYEWTLMMTRAAACAGSEEIAQRRMIDALDAYTALGVPLDDALPDEPFLQRWRGHA